jgi:methylmalonyl-CoA carboxyltransferase large subunit
MKTESADLARMTDTLEALRQEVARLSQRVAALEKAAASKGPSSPEPVQAAANEGLSEELVLVIGAAVAAYLGKKAPIRQIRLLGSAGWAQQGRLTVQASHALKGVVS